MMRLPPVVPRPPASPHKLHARRSVLIFHPAQHFPILAFPVFPSSPENGFMGFPLGTILDACYAVAFNRRGRLFEKDSLALVADESSVLDSSPDHLLVAGGYTYYPLGANGEQEEDYELCIQFKNYVPPAEIPLRWEGAVIDGERSHKYLAIAKNISEDSTAVKALDDFKCILTGAVESLSSSHLVPRSESKWWKAHQEVMQSYSPNRVASGDLNSIYNQISFRLDLGAHSFDHGNFLLVPYGGKSVVLVIDAASQTFAYDYHLREVNFPDRIPRPYLFLRFVWNVLRHNATRLESYAEFKQPTATSIQAEKPDEEDVSMEWEASSRSGDEAADVREDSSSDHSESKKRESDGGQARSGAWGRFTESYLQLLEAQDAALTARGTLTMDDERAGRYPGFSAIERLKKDYWQAHPEISAVGSGTQSVASEEQFSDGGDHDFEQYPS
ncbi:hypothetical protein C8R45DRAFT_1041174 [Mycena sanguinolenta]|nr:hypothetical protein C8R45DRAFT_1041174 [Mycena sanguinolenta]